MVDQDPAKPLAPSSDRGCSDYGEAAGSPDTIQRRRTKCLHACWTISAAIVFLLSAVAVILTFTVFRIKEPDLKMNGIRVTKLELIDGLIPKKGTNISVVADVSVKNPNAATFRYKNTTTTLYYHGAVVGEAHGEPGRAGAGRTTRMNISIDIMTDRVLTSPSLGKDLTVGTLTISSYSRVPGRITMLKFIKRHVTVKLNCSMAVNITTRQLKGQKCDKKVEL